jgi:hypothetical protein
MNRRCSTFANGTSGTPHTNNPPKPAIRDQIRQRTGIGQNHRHPGSTRRRRSAKSGTISTTYNRFAGTPPASSARSRPSPRQAQQQFRHPPPRVTHDPSLQCV